MKVRQQKLDLDMAYVQNEKGRGGAEVAKVRLGDVATYINGYAFKPSDWVATNIQGRPIIRIQDLTGNGYQQNYYEGLLPEKFAVVAGDILISWSASLGVYEWDGPEAWLNQHIFKVVFDKGEVDRRYFIHQIRVLLDRAKNEAHGCTMKHLTKPVFDALPFLMPSLAEQKQIAAKLDAICAIVAKREEQLKKLDQLVKSRFVEMFGSGRYDGVPLSEVTTKITDGTHKTPTYLDDGVVFISAKNIVDGRIDFKDVKHISQSEYDEIQRRCNLERGDLLLTKSGSLGTVAMVETDEKLGLFESLAVIKYRRDLVEGKYLSSAIMSPGVQRQFSSGTKGVAIKHLHLNVISKIEVPLPPLALQREFAAFVAEVDKSKFAVRKSLESYQKLYRQQLQEAFG